MKKKLLIAAGAAIVLALVGVATFAVLRVTGSGTDTFQVGTVQVLVVTPDASVLDGILPGDHVKMDVAVTNPNTKDVTLAALTLTFNDGDVCALDYVGPYGLPIELKAGHSRTLKFTVTMGDPAPSCAGANLEVTATAEGTLP
jgi:hypothetical protein